MNKGDTIRLNLNFTIDGVPLEETYEEMELQINEDNTKGSLKFLLSKGEIKWDSEMNMHYVELTQEESFSLSAMIRFQLRIMNGGKVISSDIGRFNIGEVLSKEVLHA